MKGSLNLDDTQELTFWNYYIEGKVYHAISSSDVYNHSIYETQLPSIQSLCSSSYHVKNVISIR